MKYVIDLISYFDLFAFTPQLYFDNKPKISTKLSKACSIIFVSIIAYFALINFHNVINY